MLHQHANLKRWLNEQTTKDDMKLRMELIGESPSVKTPGESELVEAALAIARRLGLEPELDIGSTDANIPMSLGVPAIAIGAGGASGEVHTPREWFDPTHRELGLQRLLALIAVLAGMD